MKRRSTVRYLQMFVAATRALVGALVFSLCTSLPSMAAETTNLVADICDLAAPASCTDSLISAVRAYIYGYPLVMVEVTKDVATNVENATTTVGRAPINQFSNNGLPDQTYQDVVLPSVST